MGVRSAEKEAFWRLVVDEQEASGLSIRAFCKQKSISEASFYAWRKELQRRDPPQSARQDRQAAALIPVHVVESISTNRRDGSASASVPVSAPASISVSSGHHLEVEAPNGFKLRFAPQLESDRLRDVLQVVASCSCLDDGLVGGA